MGLLTHYGFRTQITLVVLPRPILASFVIDVSQERGVLAHIYKQDFNRRAPDAFLGAPR